MIIFGNKNSKNGYAIGSIGQAGIVFYDKGSYSNGWRFIECSKTGYSKYWGGHDIVTGAMNTAIGAGKTNTIAIIAFWNTWRNTRITIANGGTWNGLPLDSVDYTGVQTELLSGKIPLRYKWDGSTNNNNPTTWTWLDDYAVKYCDNLTNEGMYDWYLPSSLELETIRTTLIANGIGGFSGYYWSSSESTASQNEKAWNLAVLENFMGIWFKYSIMSICPVRYF
jgi:hypothetical protein